ncbi:hypothetical protein GOP47_0013225 [Adiantum capillus-veneris]|uniref:Uncharacterized protein n=1 Tax=Adiantum capillus-veneris TaxID=13818 RepID=A0A9D4ZD84_ADICA|nr:hypothetical protein GOP47_0013225 [Adiantum capillus-veneris]
MFKFVGKNISVASGSDFQSENGATKRYARGSGKDIFRGEGIEAVQNLAMVESMKKLDVPIITSTKNLQKSTKLGKVFALSKKRKVDFEVFKAVRQLDFEPRTIKKVQQNVAIVDVGMAVHMLAEVQKFLSRQQIQLDNQMQSMSKIGEGTGVIARPH